MIRLVRSWFFAFAASRGLLVRMAIAEQLLRRTMSRQRTAATLGD